MKNYTVTFKADELVAATAAVMQTMTAAEKYPQYAEPLHRAYGALMNPLLTTVDVSEINEYDENADEVGPLFKEAFS